MRPHRRVAQWRCQFPDGDPLPVALSWLEPQEHRAQPCAMWKQVPGLWALLSLPLGAQHATGRGKAVDRVQQRAPRVPSTLHVCFAWRHRKHQGPGVPAFATVAVTLWTCRPIAQSKSVCSPGQRLGGVST